MGAHKILFINLGYARGIGGRLAEHIRYAYRHFYCSKEVQQKSLQQLNQLVFEEGPDVCCLVEIDKGSFGSARLNQLEVLINQNYAYFDIENKYGPESRLRSFALTAGKSNAFVARKKYPYEKILFGAGVKRLIYKITLEQNLTLFFSHFSLNKSIRARQLLEARDLMRRTEGEVIFLGDFNILTGLQEITPLLDEGRFVLLNREDHPTFLFYRHKLLLDLCVCSKNISQKAVLKILPQSWSDHAALIVEIE